MEERQYASRNVLVLVSIVTFLLLVGSALLQRIVFKAEQTYSTLYLAPSTFRAVQDKEFELSVKAVSAERVATTGLEVSLTFEPETLDFVEAVPQIGWRTVYEAAGTDSYRWVVQPIETQSPLLEFQGETTFGTLKFKALKNGFTAIKINQNQTVLAAADTAKGNELYNAALNIQGAAGTVAAATETELAFPETAVPNAVNDVPAPTAFNSQRVLSATAYPGTNNALVLISLAHVGQAKLEFGLTPELGNVVESSQRSTAIPLSILGLEPGTRYYYRVQAEDQKTRALVGSSVKSFTTVKAGSGEGTKSELVIFPDRAAKASTLYFVPRNAAGEVIDPGQVTVETAFGQATVSPLKRVGDYYQATVTTAAEKDQLVRLRVIAGLFNSETNSVLFDPAYTEPTNATSNSYLILDWSQRTVGWLLGGLALLFFFSYLFVRLARSR